MKPTDEVAARVIFAGVGGITESDVTLAEASDAAVMPCYSTQKGKQVREVTVIP